MLQNVNRRGFTMIELTIALVMGVIVLSAALSFAVTTWRMVEGNQIREGVYRSARFIAMSLERDFRWTGVGIASTTSWGTLAVWSDTVVVLGVQYEPNEAPVYDLFAPGAGPLPPGGTCGTECVDLSEVNGVVNLKPGDLARLQINGVRRLILIQSATDAGTEWEVWFTAHTQLLRYAAGLSGGLLLDRSGTFVQKLAPVIFWVENEKLMRAQGFNMDGTLDGAVLAYGVQSWDVSLIFSDGGEAPTADAGDADLTNDYDDIVGVRIKAVLAADNPHPYVSGGNLFTRSYEWWFAPRNLMYERNRI